MTTKKESSITKRSKLLCPAGCGVQQVSAIDNDVIKLECGHTRGELLKSGGVSLEQLASRSKNVAKLAHSLFPAQRDAERTSGFYSGVGCFD